MCGIAGIVGGVAPDIRLLEAMAQRMVHRGPDSQGTWSDDGVGLAVRRLAVIDLDHRSDQPLHFGHWHLVFNGEIYNYRELRQELRTLGHVFTTDGDGEVLLHAWVEWEEGALNRLNGMFALAIWHDERRELVCARDPFGEKPLCWSQEKDRFVFGSSVHCLFEALPGLGAPRSEALATFLGLGSMPPLAESFFAGIHVLPGAHLLRVNDGRVLISRYWSPSPVVVPVRYADAVDQLRSLLEDSVRLRLRSDVPVGSSLSGGVDSSAIVSIAGRLDPEARRHAFTASFPGFARDERGFAEAAARSAGVREHHIVEPTAADWFNDAIAVVEQQEEPFGSTSIYAQWRVMRAAQDADVTVLLDGQGADELFGGYNGADGWALRAQGVRASALGLVSRANRVAVLYALGSGRAPGSIARWHRRSRVGPYATESVLALVAEAAPPPLDVSGFRNPLARELLRQTLQSSLPDLLRYADRSSMALSREVRLPFLDRRVAEFALSLPPNFLYRDGIKKAVLRDAVRDLVPPEILTRRDKIGFETPQARWLENRAWTARIRELLFDPRARERGLYRTDEIESDIRSGRWRDPNGIWRAVILELWLSVFARSRAAAA